MAKKILSVSIALFIIVNLFIYVSPKKDISITVDYKDDINYEDAVRVNIDFYFIEKAATTDFTSDMIDVYKTLTNGVLQYQSKIKINNNISDRDIARVMYLFADGNPLYSLLESLSMDNGYYIVDYKMNEYKHYKAIDYIKNTFEYIISKTISKKYCESQKILAIYQYFASNYSYDNTTDKKNFIDVYDFLKNGKGLCHSYARACRFALYQLGVNTASCKGYTNSGVYHEWFLAEINGEWYHFDPTFERTKTGGQGLCYFAISDEIRLDRDNLKDGFNMGTNAYPIEVKKCTSNLFSDLWSACFWDFDEEQYYIKLQFENMQDKLFDMYEGIMYF